MTRPRCVQFVVGVLAAGLASGVATGQVTSDELDRRFRDEIRPILTASCVACHGEGEAWAGLRFDTVTTLDEALAFRHDFAIARERVALMEMPPAGQPQPTEAERAALLAWLDDLVGFRADEPATVTDPGWFTVRRLNTDEYRYTMRDLLGIDPAEHDLGVGLPADDLGYGFDTIGDVLTTSTLHVEAYLEAAERALELSLGPVVEVSDSPRRLELTVGGGGRVTREGGVHLFSNGAAVADVQVPYTGEYEIAVRARGTRGGDELPRLSIRVDGETLLDADVASTAEGAAQIVRIGALLEGGSRSIEADFTNDFYIKGEADRNLLIEAVTLTGPVAVAPTARPEWYGRVMIAEPGLGAAGERESARTILGAFADRAYRRPVSGDELEALIGVYDRSRFDGDGYERAVRTALTACLVSPHFLYRAPANPWPNDPSRVYRLSDHELASRLSYFLWSSQPDGELRRLADLGLLSDDRVLSAQVSRMLTDEKAWAFVDRFAGQWLLLRQLEMVEIDRERFPAYDDALREAMIAEATHAFADLVRRNGSVTELVDAGEVFINDRLAAHYGIDGVRGSTIRRVRLGNETPRGGMLTSAAVLTLTSNPVRTSPVKRGLFVLDQVLGTPPPPPPPDIAPLEQAQAAVGPGATLREQLAAHVADPSCAACHVQMDPIGLALENFDAIGRWRDEAYGLPIDASGTLPSGESFDGPRELKRVLMSREPQIRRNLAERLLIYAIGRGLEPFDRPTVDSVLRRADDSGGGIADLIRAVALSDAFRACRARHEP